MFIIAHDPFTGTLWQDTNLQHNFFWFLENKITEILIDWSLKWKLQTNISDSSAILCSEDKKAF